MQFLLRPLSHSRNHHQHIQQRRRIYDAAISVKYVHDRGLDHAVERERNLKPLLNLKNLIKSEPSKSLPLSLIVDSKDSIQIPVRPIEFVRRYPSIFEEFLPGGIGIHPHIKLSSEVINYDKEEEIIYQSLDYKQEVADRLLKLLMISRINKIPISVIDRIKWDMGLPQDYVKTIVPEFPDCFRVSNGGDLELVCWSNELALPVIEKKGVEPVVFSLSYSNGFEMDKKYKKWVDEWQKLPYISPYENAQHLVSKSDESDKWAVAVLHEILNLFVGKKAEKDTVLSLGEYLGLRARFKRALLQHPGIFYVSSKIGTHTVVLKDAYKRGMLIKKHPLMQMRSRYVQLMNAGKEDQKSKSVQQKTSSNSSSESQMQEESRDDGIDGEYEDDDLSDEEGGDYDYEDDEEEDEEEDDDDDDDNEEYENVNQKSRGRFSQKTHFARERSPRLDLSRSAERNSIEKGGKSRERYHLRTEVRDSQMAPRRSQKMSDDSEEYENVNPTTRGRFSQKRHFDRERSPRPASRRSAERNSIEEGGKSRERYHLRTEVRDSQMAPRRSQKRSDDIEEYENANRKTRGRVSQKTHFDREGSPRPALRRSAGRNSFGNGGKSTERYHPRTEVRDSQMAPRRSEQNLHASRNRGRSQSKRRAST